MMMMLKRDRRRGATDALRWRRRRRRQRQRARAREYGARYVRASICVHARASALTRPRQYESFRALIKTTNVGRRCRFFVLLACTRETTQTQTRKRAHLHTRARVRVCAGACARLSTSVAPAAMLTALRFADRSLFFLAVYACFCACALEFDEQPPSHTHTHIHKVRTKTSTRACASAHIWRANYGRDGPKAQNPHNSLDYIRPLAFWNALDDDASLVSPMGHNRGYEHRRSRLHPGIRQLMQCARRPLYRPAHR